MFIFRTEQITTWIFFLRGKIGSKLAGGSVIKMSRDGSETRTLYTDPYIHVYVFIRIIASFYEPGYLWEEFPPELPSLWQGAMPRDRYSFHLLPDIPFVHRAINSTNAKCGKLMSAASTWTQELRFACVIRAELLYKPRFQFVAHSNSSRSGTRTVRAFGH